MLNKFTAWCAAWLLCLTNGVLDPASTNGQDFATDRATNWHQWRGPEANGYAAHAQPPLQWSQDQNLRWKAEVPGVGKSSPIVWGDRVFLTSAIDTGTIVPGKDKPEDQPERPFGIKFPNTVYRFVVCCFDRSTGQLLWQQTAVEAVPHEGHHGDNSHASASATTDGQRVYVSFGSRGMYAYSLEGELLWKLPLKEVQTRLSFGEGSSPVVHGDTVVLVRDNETASEILAIDTATGQVKWSAPRDEVSAWATPLITEFDGRTQVITSASKRVRSYDLATGAVIWECGGQVANVTPSPVRFGDHVICMSGYRGSIAVSLPLAASGDITGSSEIAWKFDRETPYIPSPLLVEDRVYFHKLNAAILTSLDTRTGEPRLETTRIPDVANVYASAVGAGRRIYVTGRGGTTAVLEHGDELKVLAINRLDDAIDASAALAGPQLFLRGARHLYCIQEK